MPCSAGFSQRKQKTCPQPWASQARFSPVSEGHCGFVFTGKPAVPGFSTPTFDEGKSCRQKKQKNFTKALAVFFRSEYITATDAADMIRDTRRAISSVGRAPRLHRGCREFESLIAHHFQAYQIFELEAECQSDAISIFRKFFAEGIAPCPTHQWMSGLRFSRMESSCDFSHAKSVLLFQIPTASPSPCITPQHTEK